MGDWQPIETAPRDGTAILLCWARDASGQPIRWDKKPDTAIVYVQVAKYSGEPDREWYVYIATPADAALHFTPTHWMPLPPPPAKAKGEAS
jgi:hypothetical protein